MKATLTFITGPVRAGKSTLAERFARESGLPVTYCATAANDRDDAEWVERIERHRAQRPASWKLCESAGPRGIDLVAKLRETEADECLLIESLGTWLADALGRGSVADGDDVLALHRDVAQQAEGLVQAIVESRAMTIVVSEEVGWGVVPPFPSGRIFRDVIARANRSLVAAAGRAYLVVSGVAFDLKSATPIDLL